MQAHSIESDNIAGFTRRAIGATFEGQTKETDGQVWAEAEVDGIGSDVGIHHVDPVWVY